MWLAHDKDRGTVGCGATMGLPAPILDPTGPTVAVQVLESAELLAHWERLDQFEGTGLPTRRPPVITADGTVPPSIYVLAPD
jgi:gamma-glutamylcyclotransferase (GGCT)/AIG2-like uncharacterized protein YtfP